MNRYIATIRLSVVTNGMACDGNPSEIHNGIVIAIDQKAANRIADRRATELNGLLLCVEPETDEHCFKTLEPEGWARMEETRIELARLATLYRNRNK